ncbi:MAG: hypothetical protein RLZZ342_106 [Candidatus Parcubacteria bacterium]|jgi:hypothetical protein
MLHNLVTAGLFVLFFGILQALNFFVAIVTRHTPDGVRELFNPKRKEYVLAWLISTGVILVASFVMALRVAQGIFA